MVCKAIDMCEVQIGRLKPSGFMRWAQSHPEVRFLFGLGLGSLHPDRSTAPVPQSYHED
ncbi:hypothetical protein HanXRQr2_Chr07g0308921 [Helianthus annuus]|uniref:Uncharacterized protein n=1 Tax=Helianthus annuus TaxID=4232 RepID=A0A251UD78_HELAN|nr:hypothetical protein HanXRQr2_Chr07g0308921 [Helianthus annuus]